MTTDADARRGHRGFVIVAALVLVAAVASAEPVTLAWDPNPPEENVTGYIVYYGVRSRTDPAWTGYDSEVDAGAVTEFVVELPNEYQVYYFSAVAYNEFGLRSDYSDEIFRPPRAPGRPRNLRRP